MADDLDDLQRLAPGVDSDTASAAFRRRRHQSRSRRRGAMAAAAVMVLVAGTVAVLTSADDDTSVTAGPGVDEPMGPVTFEVLAVTEASDEMGTLRAAVDDDEYTDLWAASNSAEARPGVDFDEQVVVSITIPDNACPPELTEFERDGDVITPVFVEPAGGCDDPLIPKTYVVVLDRAPLGAAFTLRLPASEVYGYDEQRLLVDLSGDAASTGDLPTVWAQEPSPSADSMGAEVKGGLRYDASHGCFSVEFEGLAYPVVWPAGTVGTADGPGVVLPDGEIARVGDEVYGGGGYLQVADEYGIPAACLPTTGEVAVYNPNEDVEVNPAPGIPAPESTCAEIEAFTDQLVDVGISYDYQPSASPEALFAESDLVLFGTLTGGFDVRPGEGDGLDYVGYEVAVSVVYKGPPGADITDPLTIWVPVGAIVDDGAAFRDAIATGASVIAFADLDPTVGFVASIEGLATGCGGGPPLGFVGTAGDWADVETLGDLAVRLELLMAGP